MCSLHSPLEGTRVSSVFAKDRAPLIQVLIFEVNRQTHSGQTELDFKYRSSHINVESDSMDTDLNVIWRIGHGGYEATML